MKRFLAITIIAIFLLSLIPLSLADDDEDESDDRLEKLREISEEKREKALEKIKEHQEKMLEHQEKVKELKEKVNSNKKSNKGSRQHFENSREFMLINIDLMIEYLEKLKSRVDSSEDISDEEAQDIIEEIDERIEKLKERRQKILDDQEIEELRDELKELKKLHGQLKDFSIESVDKIKHRRLGEIIKRAEAFEAKLDRIIANANVTNQSQVNSLVEQFKAKIASARDKYEDGLEFFEDARNASSSFERHLLIISAHERLVSAQFDLKSAHFILKEIFRLVRPVRLGEEPETPPTNQTGCSLNIPNITSKNFGYIIYKNNCDNKTWTVVIKDTTEHGFVDVAAIKNNVSFYDGKEVKVEGTLKFVGVDINTDPRFVIDDQGNQIRVGVFAPLSANTSCPTCPVQNNTMLGLVNTEIRVLGNVSLINETNVSVPIITVTRLLSESDIISRANGTISTNTTFSNVERHNFESGDTLGSTNNTISFNVTMDSLDKVTFKTDGTVTYDLYIDGARQKNFVYLGTTLSNPSDIPFSLSTTQ